MVCNFFKSKRRKFIEETAHFLDIFYYHEKKSYRYDASDNESIRVYVDKINDRYVMEYFPTTKTLFLSKTIITEVYDAIPDKKLRNLRIWKKILEKFLDVKIKMVYIY